MKSLFYSFTLIISGFLLVVSNSYAENLPSGGSVSGALGLNQTNSHTFTAGVGDSITLSADPTKPTIMYLYNPDGTYRTYGYNLLTVNNLPVAGTYRVDIRTKIVTDTATYQLFFTNSSTANEHGLLPSGGSVLEELTSNDLDTYTFTAEVGDSISLAADSTNSANPTIMYLYNPDGTYRTYGYNLLTVNNLPVAGTYHVLIRTKIASKVTDYELHYFNSSTANEIGLFHGGTFTNNNLTSNDLDSYTINIQVGDSISLSASSTEPTIMYLYNPDGTYRTYGYTSLTVNNLPVAGTYRVMIRTKIASKVTDYQLHYFNSATATEHGFLPSGGSVLEELTSNDLDTYLITAKVGDSISLSADSAEPTIMYLYNPDGTYRTYGYNLLTVNNLPVAGIYRVMIRTKIASKVTDYQLHYFNGATSNEIGYMANTSFFNQDLTSNDLDSYAFTAEVGDSITLSASSTEPTIMYLYNPDGTYRTYGYTSLTVNNLPVAGTYRVMIRTKIASKVTDYQLVFNSSGNPLLPEPEECRHEAVGYDSKDKAAWAAFNQSYSDTVNDVNEVEVGGEIYKVCNPNGINLYNYAYRKIGKRGGYVNPNPPTVAGWHTHPKTNNLLYTNSQNFSEGQYIFQENIWQSTFPYIDYFPFIWVTGDLGFVMNFDIPLYLGIPATGVLKVLPVGSTSITQAIVVPPQ